MLQRIELNELEDHLMANNPILSIPRFRDLLNVGRLGYYKVYKNILINTLNKFENTRPLRVRSTIFMDGDSHQFVDNYRLCVNGDLDWNRLSLVPKSIISLGGTILYSNNRFKYVAPVMRMQSFRGDVLVKYYAKYPYILDSVDGKMTEFTPDSHIAGLELGFNSHSDAFVVLLTLNILRYIRSLKSITEFQDLPINYLANINEEINILETIYEDYVKSNINIAESWE